MSFGLPDKPRDEDEGWCYHCLEESCQGCGDLGVNDDASEWSPEPFLDRLGDEPVTLEELVAYLEDMDLIEANALQHGATIPVEKLLSHVKERRGK